MDDQLNCSFLSGYTSRHQSFIEIRRQIIVVVFDTWHVVTYDADLKLLWQVQLLDVPHDISQVCLTNTHTHARTGRQTDSVSVSKRVVDKQAC